MAMRASSAGAGGDSQVPSRQIIAVVGHKVRVEPRGLRAPTDPQAAFKAFPATALRTALPLTADHSLPFNTGLLAAVARCGHTVAEVGVAALHQYIEGHRSTTHDYDTMLNGIHRQALRHGLDPDTRRTPTWDRIRQAGSLAAAAAEATTTTLLKAPTSR
ncbi:hypothetical protein ACGFIE_00955 [Micromonospora sp. NPDC049275]|uniref:hypothetical protein n=1 Tax=Micromonospora sp. NPDC049275 TaxID=3364268 RepID=UPI0037164D3D